MLTFLCTLLIGAQTVTSVERDTVRGSVRISFPVSESRISPEFDGNRRQLDSLNSILNRLTVDTNATVLSMSVHGYGSIDGLYKNNDKLSRERTDSIVAYIMRRSVLPRELIATSSTAEDWDGFASYVENATKEQLPHRDGILKVIGSSRTPDGKEWAIKQMYPKDYRYLADNCLPQLRRAYCQVDYMIVRPVAPEPTVEKVEEAVVDTLPAEPMLPVLPMMGQKCRRRGIAVKTNLLYDAALIPNIGIEVYLGRRWTASADWFYTWLSFDNRHYYWQGYGGYLTLRKYFGKASHNDLFIGHHIGVYGLGMTYDVEWGGRGYQGARFGFGGGVEYGYSTKIGKRLSLDFSLGVGFQDGEYKEYLPMDGHYVWQSTHKRHWWGPTKAEVTLKWQIGGCKKKCQKGGSR